jgi:hypothetical protein
MFRPTTGELLEGIAHGLRESVLPHVPPGAEERQLRAALHTLRRLRLSWDLLPEYLETDCADMRTTIHAVLTRVASQPGASSRDLDSLARRLAALEVDPTTPVRGVNSPKLRAQCSTHAQLQQLLLELERSVRRSSAPSSVEAARALDELYDRMNRRQLHAWGEGGGES